jgi:uncharacterized caspase-like protein
MTPDSRISTRFISAIAILLLTAALAHAQERVALVIGNGKYVHANALPNPANDARAVAEALREVGFTVVPGTDLDRSGMERALFEFMDKARNSRIALIFYAGHGLQVEGRNYLVPIDARLESARDLNFGMIELDKVLASLDDPSRANIVILDACRDNPLARSFASKTRSGAVGAGLAAYTALGTGTLIAFATAPDKVALDGQGTNSPFTEGLVKHLRTPGLEIRQMLTRVRADVARATSDRQVPWDNSSLRGDVYLAGLPTASDSARAQPQPPPAPQQASEAERVWAVTKDTTSLAVLETFIGRFSGTIYADMARARLEEIKRSQAAAAPPRAQPAPAPQTAPPQNAVAALPPARTERAPQALWQRAKITGSVYSVSVSPDGKLVATSGSFGAQIWDAESGRPVREFSSNSVLTKTVAFSPDGTHLAGATNDKVVRIWDVASGSVVRTLGGHGEDVNTVAYSPAGDRMASGSRDKTVAIWDAKTGRRLHTIKADSITVNAVSFSPDGRRLVSAGSEVQVWDVATARRLQTIEYSGIALSATFSRDGNKIVAGISDNTVKVWDASNGKVLHSLTGHSDDVQTVAVTPDGRFIVSGAEDKTLKVWEIDSGRLVRTISAHDDKVRSVTFSPDGRRLFSGSWDDSVKAWAFN